MKPKNKIKRLREKTGLTMSQLAAKAGVSRSTIVRAERDGRYSTVALIAAAHRLALGVTP